MKIKLTKREAATILVALSVWQEKLNEESIEMSRELMDIATDNGRLEPLSAYEIDALCERIEL